MANFIGEIGGLLMVALIATLFFRLIIDTFDLKEKMNSRIMHFIIFGAVVGLIQIFVASLLSGVFAGKVKSPFDFESIWHKAPVSDSIDIINDYSLEKVFEKRQFPLYYLLSNLLSKVLFNQTLNSAFYISFLSGIVTFFALGNLASKAFNDEETNKDKRTVQLFDMVLCIPCSALMFLPCPISLCMMLISLFFMVLSFEKNHKFVLLALSLLSCITHVLGFVTLIVLIANLFMKNCSKTIACFVLPTVSFIFVSVIGLIFNLVGIVEFIVPMAIILMFYICTRKKMICYEAELSICLINTILNGVFILYMV
jgi:hypothetical protein